MIFLGMTLTLVLAGVGGTFLHAGDEHKGIAFLIAAGLMVLVMMFYYRKRSKSRQNGASPDAANSGPIFDCWVGDCGGAGCDDISDLSDLLDCGGCDVPELPDCDCGGCD